MKYLKSIVKPILILKWFIVSSLLLSLGINAAPLHIICAQWPPYEYSGKDGKPAGFSVEILQAILNDLAIKNTVEFYPWKRAYLKTLNTPNTLLFTVARTPDRENKFKWVGPIGSREVYLWKLKSRTDIRVNNLQEAKNYLIGTTRGYASETDLINKGFMLNEHLDSVTVPQQNYEKLYAGRIDLIIDLELTAYYGILKTGLDFSQLERSILITSGTDLYFAFNVETPQETVEKFQTSLIKIKENGIFDKILQKYKLP